MKLRAIIFIALGMLLSCKHDCNQEDTIENKVLNEEKGAHKREISFYTTDSIQVYGDLYEVNKKGSTLLLFHQGGSNARAEYGPIIPRLIEKGFNIIAIDQRSGGQWYGSYNRTLARVPTNGYGDGYTYCDAYNNLEGALDYITEAGFSGKKILWGSSYSASLSIQLGYKRQSEVDGVLAFSPATGGAMKNCLPNAYFKDLKIPLLLLRPPSEMESDDVKLQMEMAQEFNHSTHVATKGIHGSSMLVTERVGADVKDTWKVVFAFLEHINLQ